MNGSKQHKGHHHDVDSDHEADHVHSLEFGPEEVAIARKHINTLFPLANLPVSDVLPALCCFKKSNKAFA
tara:strand:+ start:183 stop:392 length:210 start_codon:yes stop_codon:yes gene_type:complete